MGDGLEGAFGGEEFGLFAGVEVDADSTAGAVDADFDDETDAFLGVSDAHADLEADGDIGGGFVTGEECGAGGEEGFAAESAELFDPLLFSGGSGFG